MLACRDLIRETFERVWVMKKIGVHKNYYWHMQEYLLEVNLRPDAKVKTFVSKLPQYVNPNKVAAEVKRVPAQQEVDEESDDNS